MILHRQSARHRVKEELGNAPKTKSLARFTRQPYAKLTTLNKDHEKGSHAIPRLSSDMWGA